MDRRSFLKSTAAAAIGSVILPKISWGSPWVPVLQGTTDSSSTWVSAVVPASGESKLVLLRKDGSALPHSSLESYRSPTGSHRVIRAMFTGLRLRENYRLEVRGKGGKLLDHRSLRAFDHENTHPRLAFVSCMNHLRSDRARDLWKELASHRPDAAFFMGDTVYVDAETTGGPAESREEFWEQYLEAFHSVEFFRLPELIPVFATWDDHDFGANDGDATYPLGGVARELFHIFMGQRLITGFSERGPGVSGRVRIGKQFFYLLDNRSFRSPKNEPDGTHWGKAQEDWLFANIAGTDGAAWIISGSQFFGDYLPKESYAGDHPKSFERILSRLRDLRKPVVFASGDRHFSELMGIEPAILGYRTFEITSSGMQSNTFPVNPWVFYPNRRQIAGEALKNTYVIIESKLDGIWPRIKATGYAKGKDVVFDEILEVR